MSTPTDGILEPRDAPAAALAGTRPFYWSVRRELWENRSLYVGPLAAAAVVLLGFTISLATLPHRMRAVPALDAAQQHAAIALPYTIAAILVALTTFIVGAFYCLDALLGERRDRAILFWKSLPVSDLTTVLSKVSVPLLLLPLFAFAVILVTQLLMLLLNTAVLLATGGVATLWSHLPVFQMPVVALYGLAAHALWHAPLYAWLLLVSAWARRTPFLWAVLPPLAVCALEKIAFGTSYCLSLLCGRVTGATTVAFAPKLQCGVPIDRLAQLAPLHFLSRPGLWVGLAVAAAFLAAAVRLRRQREPI